MDDETYKVWAKMDRARTAFEKGLDSYYRFAAAFSRETPTVDEMRADIQALRHIVGEVGRLEAWYTDLCKSHGYTEEG